MSCVSDLFFSGAARMALVSLMWATMVYWLPLLKPAGKMRVWYVTTWIVMSIIFTATWRVWTRVPIRGVGVVIMVDVLVICCVSRIKNVFLREIFM